MQGSKPQLQTMRSLQEKNNYRKRMSGTKDTIQLQPTASSEDHITTLTPTAIVIFAR